MNNQPRHIGRYEIRDELGSGGFGTVYRAWDPALKLEVALKVLNPRLASRDPALVQGFLHEVRVAARLHHPNIVRIYNVGETEGQYYFTMHYLRGPTLSECIDREAPMTTERVLELLTPIASALDYAHGEGLVHRDVKPSNIIFDAEGQPVLVDFGLVKAAQDSSYESLPRWVPGTVQYAAPEQLSTQRADEVGPATDVYALGIVAYQMLTKQVPFEGETAAVIGSQLHDPPPPPREMNPDIPEAVEAALLQALAKTPAERYESAGVFVAALGEGRQHDEREQQWQALYDQAQAAFDRDDWETAIRHLEELTADAAEYRDAADLLARARERKDQAEAGRRRRDELVAAARAARDRQDWEELRQTVRELRELDEEAARPFEKALEQHEREERERQQRLAGWYEEARQCTEEDPERALSLVEQIRAEDSAYPGIKELERWARREKSMTETVARRTTPPCTVPPGGAAVVLVDGHVADEDPIQGPGRLSPERWRDTGQTIEAVVFPARTLRLELELSDLRTAEGVGVGLTVTLALRLDKPVTFLTDVVRERERLTHAELAGLLQETVSAGLAPAVRTRSLSDLYTDEGLRAWLGTTIEAQLRDEADLLNRSGLAVRGVDAFDLYCEVQETIDGERERWYLRAGLEAAEAKGRRILAERMLAQIREHVPVKEELVEHKEKLADLGEREAAADERLEKTRKRRRSQLEARIDVRRTPPSELRPEIWRHDLEEDVRTAPATDSEHVFVASDGGRVHAFTCADGEPAWPEPAELAATPGDGMAVAAGTLWVPGHDGVLYGLDTNTGAVRHRIEIGGRLSSPPLAAGNRLYLSVDVDAATLRPGQGDVVVADARQGELQGQWSVSKHGLRAQPALLDRTLYVGDRRGRFFSLNARSGRVEQIPVRAGRILAAAQVDKQRSQVVFGDSYGRVVALDRAGRERWSRRLGGAVVGQPLLYDGTLFVGAGDGRVYALNPASGEQVWEPFATNGPIATPPVGQRGLIFVGSNDGYLYALDAATGEQFWQYHSGAPVFVPPAMTTNGRLFVMDGEGHLNALRWCLSRYAEAARRAQRAEPPRWGEVAELRMLEGDTEAAIEAAEQAGRLDLVAELAASSNWHDKAAHAYERLARRSSDPQKAANWWAEAAGAWEMAQNEEKAATCRLEDARARNAPLLALEEANLPALTMHQPDEVQVRVYNLTDTLARDVRLNYRGHVQQADTLNLGSLGPNQEKTVSIEVVPTKSGSARLWVQAHYAGSRGRPQRAVGLEVRLKVDRPPEVHHHGPVVRGDGVIVMRGERAGSGRSVQVQSGEDQIRVERSGRAEEVDACPACGADIVPDALYCHKCQQRLS